MIAGFAVFYLLVLVRILAFFSMMPLFDQKRIPAMWKVAVGVLFTIIVIPMLTPIPFTVNVVWIAFAVLWEAVLGFCFGMVFTTAVGAVLSAGSLVDMQMGFANAGILNPGGGAAGAAYCQFHEDSLHVELLGGFGSSGYGSDSS